MTTSYDIVAAHTVEEMLVQVLVFAELPHCFIGKERSSEGDVVHFESGSPWSESWDTVTCNLATRSVL